MLQFKFLTEQDRKESAAIARRRANEEERRKRIFDPRNRKFGVDINALQQQIEEKQKQISAEKELENQFDQQRIRDDRLAVILAKKQDEEKKRIEAEINNFRRIHQRKEERREFDIYDPDQLKKEIPAKLQDDDPRLGLGSCQKFAGEDLSSGERKKLIIEQQRAFLTQQMEEREAANFERKMAEEAYQKAIVARDKRALELDELERECRRKLDMANLRYNKAIADEQAVRKKEFEKQEEEDKQAEMYNSLMSDMMLENTDVAKSNLGANRIIGFKYKGMSEEERKAVREFQKKQVADHEKRLETEKRTQQDWENYSLNINKCAEKVARDLERKKQEILKRTAEENSQLAEEQKAHTEHLNKVVYANKLTSSFYEQFGTSSR